MYVCMYVFMYVCELNHLIKNPTYFLRQKHFWSNSNAFERISKSNQWFAPVSRASHSTPCTVCSTRIHLPSSVSVKNSSILYTCSVTTRLGEFATFIIVMPQHVMNLMQRTPRNSIPKVCLAICKCKSDVRQHRSDARQHQSDVRRWSSNVRQQVSDTHVLQPLTDVERTF